MSEDARSAGSTDEDETHSEGQSPHARDDDDDNDDSSEHDSASETGDEPARGAGKIAAAHSTQPPAAKVGAGVTVTDPRFDDPLPEPLEAVRSVELVLPGKGSGTRHTVRVSLSEPPCSFEQRYRAQLTELRRTVILQRLRGDRAAISAFHAHEREAERLRRTRGEDEGDGEDANADGGAGDGDTGADESEKDGGEAGAYITVEAETRGAALTPAQHAREERLRRRRVYPYWLPALLANDSTHFEWRCCAMYGWAVPPPAPPVAGGDGGGTVGGARGRAGRAYSQTNSTSHRRASSKHTVSFRVSGEGADEPGSGAGDGEEEDDDASVMADPARKSSAFFYRSGAFGGEDEGDGSRAAMAASQATTLAGDGVAAAPGVGTTRDSAASRASVTEESERHRSVGGVETTLPGLAAFPDANYPLYLAWEMTEGEWHLLDVHPDIYNLRVRQAERRAREEQRARAEARRRRAEEGGAPEVDSEDGGQESGSEGVAETEGDGESGEESGSAGTRVDGAGQLQFDTQSMIAMDALMLAALRSPAALRLMLLQNPSREAGKTAQGAGGAASDDAPEPTGAGQDEYSERVAAGERLVSLRNIEEWMAVDFASGFPILSAVYVALLTIRAKDAPRLPYSLVPHLPFDVNIFFTDDYVFSRRGVAQLIGAEQNSDCNPMSKRLDSIASPRSAAAVGLLRSLLRAGIVPRAPVVCARLNSPESVQLALWLLMVVPRGLLEAWGRAARARLVRALERVAAGSPGDVADGGGGGGGGGNDEDNDADEAEEEEGEEDGSAMTNDAAVVKVVLAARRADRARVRGNRRVLRLMQKRKDCLACAEQAARHGTAADVDEDVAEVVPHPSAAEIDLRPLFTAFAAASREVQAGGNANASTSTSGSGSTRDGGGAVARRDDAWRRLSDAAAAWQGSHTPPRPFLPCELLLRTALEVRRRVARERAGREAPPYALTLAVEEPLQALLRVVEDGAIIGDELVTGAFRMHLPTTTTPAVAGVKDATPAVSPSTASEVAVRPPRRGGSAEAGEPTAAVTGTAPQVSRAQRLFQSDLVLLLLALTTTAGGAAELRAESPEAAARGERLESQSSPRQPRRSTVARGRTLATVVSHVSELGPQVVADGHTEVFCALLRAKLGRADRAGAPAASLLAKLRSGTLRLLFSALRRFAAPATAQALCDAAPLFELLGSNERCPLIELAQTWAAEQEAQLMGPGGAAAGAAAAAVTMPTATMTTTATTAPTTTTLGGGRPRGASLSTSLPSMGRVSHAGNGGDSAYLRCFAHTFWSEIAYRFEAGLFPAGTRELLRATLPALLGRVEECVEAYTGVVGTLKSGSRLRHSAIAHGLATFVAAYAQPTQLMAFAEAFPMLGSSNAAARGPHEERSSSSQAPPLCAKGLLRILNPYSEEYQQDEERLRVLLDTLPMAPRTIYTPELLHTLLFASKELDVVAVRVLMIRHGIVTVREGGPFSLYGRSTHSGGGGGGGAAEGAAPADRAVPVGCELPALEYALRTANARVARLLVVIGLPLTEPAFDGACTLETLADRCLTAEEAAALRLLSQRRREVMKIDPECRYGGVRVS